MHGHRVNNRDRGILIRLFAVAGTAGLLNVLAWELTAGVAPLASIYMLVIVPLIPIPVMMCLGFVEHSLRSLLNWSVVCAIPGLLVARMHIGPFAESQLAYFVPAYLLGMWFFGMLGAGVGVAVSTIMAYSRKIPDYACKHCGYNLTGNVSGICPECGKPIEAGTVVPDAQGNEDSPS